MKDSFILYNSFYEPIKSLKNEQLGKLLRAIFNYTINDEITQDDDILIAFMFIKNQIDLDTAKWQEEKQKRSEAGKLGGIRRALNKSQNLSSKSKQCLEVLSKGKQCLEVLSKGKQTQANQADNVNVNVNVNDNVNVNNIKENIKRKNFVKPTIEEIQNYCGERNNGINAEAFYDFYESKNWYVGKNKMKDWQACVRTWEKRQDPNQVKMKVSTPQPKWLDMTISEEKATEEEIKQLEKRLNRK